MSLQYFLEYGWVVSDYWHHSTYLILLCLCLKPWQKLVFCFSKSSYQKYLNCVDLQTRKTGQVFPSYHCIRLWLSVLRLLLNEAWEICCKSNPLTIFLTCRYLVWLLIFLCLNLICQKILFSFDCHAVELIERMLILNPSQVCCSYVSHVYLSTFALLSEIWYEACWLMQTPYQHIHD